MTRKQLKRRKLRAKNRPTKNKKWRLVSVGTITTPTFHNYPSALYIR